MPAPPAHARAELPQAVNAAYGFRIEGLEPTPLLALTGAEGWPTLRLEQRIEGDLGPPGSHLGADEAWVRIPLGRLVLDRVTGTVTVCSQQEVRAEEVVHPCLWPAAAIHARWRGAETLHAGLIAPPGSRRAWAVLAESGGGKSSLATAAVRAGWQVLTDDLVVLDGDRAYAGPRCVDVRPEAASALGLGSLGGGRPVRSTQRLRLDLGPAPGVVEVAGFVHLTWCEAPGVDRLAPHEALAVLAHHRRVSGLGADHTRLLELAGLPMVRLRRVRSWERTQGAWADLIAAIGPGT